MSDLPLQPLVWFELKNTNRLICEVVTPICEYSVWKNVDSVAYSVLYYNRHTEAPTKEATGFATIDEAKQWAWDHYNEKMQPYVKPMPTWVNYGMQKPTEKGSYLIRDHQGRLTVGKFDNVFYMDYGGENWGIVSHWMPIPEFSTMQNPHKGE